MNSARKAAPLPDEWISLPEAARLLGESRHTVLNRSVKGEVEAQFIAGRTIVLRESIQRVLAARANS